MTKEVIQYMEKLGEIPEFLKKYLSLNSLKRLEKIGYFCGMDYASNEVYPFSFYVSRYDHSISTAIITWRFTHDKKATLAALFHDIATPCFSHVIDYMNGDYKHQESTEENHFHILKQDLKLKELLKQDQLELEDIIDFKKYTIVDNDRPKICADRLDGILITSLAWTKLLSLSEVSEIIENITVIENEKQELELSFSSFDITKRMIYLNDKIDEYCHSNADNYMMNLLANMTKIMIQNNLLKYEDLYLYGEEYLIELYRNYANKNKDFSNMFNQFENIKWEDIPIVKLPDVKIRNINPLVDGRRYYEIVSNR